MTNNITTLALNILISERQAHRDIFATKIKARLQRLKVNSKKELETKQAFLSTLALCVKNPTCQVRDLFYEYAEYYNRKLAMQRNVFSSAAAIKALAD